MVGCRLWRFFRQRQRDRHADAQQQHRRIRDLRHHQQSHHVGCRHGAGRPGMAGRRFRHVRPESRRSRHADAKQKYRRDWRSTTSVTTPLPRRPAWGRSGWSGRTAGLRRPRRVATAPRLRNSLSRWRRSPRPEAHSMAFHSPIRQSWGPPRRARSWHPSVKFTRPDGEICAIAANCAVARTAALGRFSAGCVASGAKGSYAR